MIVDVGRWSLSKSWQTAAVVGAGLDVVRIAVKSRSTITAKGLRGHGVPGAGGAANAAAVSTWRSRRV